MGVGLGRPPWPLGRDAKVLGLPRWDSVGEIVIVNVGALLQRKHVTPGHRQAVRQDAAGRAGAYDTDFGLLHARGAVHVTLARNSSEA
jgi:hypothetical protein